MEYKTLERLKKEVRSESAETAAMRIIECERSIAVIGALYEEFRVRKALGYCTKCGVELLGGLPSICGAC